MEQKKAKSKNEIDLINTFSNQLNQLIYDKKYEKVYVTFENEMYKKIGIGKTTLQNYKKDYKSGGKLPRYDELIRIHDYFNVSYSYLFGESNLKSNNNANIDIGVKLGIDDKSLSILQDLKDKASKETIDDNFDAQTKLFLINSFIQDKKLLDSLVAYIPIILGRNILDKKYNGKPKYKSYTTDNSIYEMTKYAIISNSIKSLDALTTEENVPLIVAKNSEEYALKYAGAMQPIIKEILSDKK